MDTLTQYINIHTLPKSQSCVDLINLYKWNHLRLLILNYSKDMTMKEKAPSYHALPKAYIYYFF